ncbi:hypothetical protein Goshw_022389 [Gossypium schwendimanii]|uniref:Uncharacterized protein n=1 Tax=Gossypium schwendimanii TaxID=34291 RepID=A0A7J9LQA6_GOSSC|nr:hypothetical protein [Gossypium schwendimanii]
MSIVACLQFYGDGNESSEGGEGGEVVGNKGGEGEGEGGEVAGSKGGEGVEGQGVREGGEVAEGLGGEGDDVAISEGGESDGGGEEGVDVTVSEGGESDGGGKKGLRDESDSDSKDENAYLMKVMYLPDGDDDEELQEARQKFEAKVLEEVDGEGLNDSVSREKMEIRLNILTVMIMGAYLGHKMMTILMFIEEEVGSPHTIQT